MERYDSTANPFSHEPWEYSSIQASWGKFFTLAGAIYLWIKLPCPTWLPINIFQFLFFCIFFGGGILAVIILVKVLCIHFFIHDKLQKEVDLAKYMAIGSKEIILSKVGRKQFVVLNLRVILQQKDDIIQNWGKILADKERMRYFKKYAKEHFSLIKNMWQEDIRRLNQALEDNDDMYVRYIFRNFGVSYPKGLRIYIDQPKIIFQEVENVKKQNKQLPLMRLTENYSVQFAATITSVIFLNNIFHI